MSGRDPAVGGGGCGGAWMRSSWTFNSGEWRWGGWGQHACGQNQSESAGGLAEQPGSAVAAQWETFAAAAVKGWARAEMSIPPVPHTSLGSGSVCPFKPQMCGSEPRGWRRPQIILRVRDG
jgi:hypothetical protein